MKKLYFIFLLGIMSLWSCGCSHTTSTKKGFSAPENLYLSISFHSTGETEYVLEWEKVDGATVYTVETGDTTVSVTTEKYDLTKYVKEGEDISCTVTAKNRKRSASTVYEGKAESVTEGLSFRRVQDGFAVSKGNANVEGRLVLPDYYEEKSVVEIDSYAFGSSPSALSPGVPQPALKEVRYPKNLQNVGDYAFYYCINLKTPPPLSVKRIGVAAFNKVHQIQFFDLSNVEEIGDSAFALCENLQTLVLPKTNVKIGSSAFYNCRKLSDISFPDQAVYIGSGAFNHTAWLDNHADGMVAFGNVLYDYKGEPNAMIEIDSKYSVLAGSALANLQKLEEVRFLGEVYTLGESCFANNPALKKITLPKGIKEIPSACFNVSGLTEIFIPKSVEKISDGAFTSCQQLKKVEFAPESELKRIEFGAFLDTDIEEISLPNNLREFSLSAVSQTEVTRLFLPSKVKLLQGGVGENKIARIEVDEKNPYYTAEDGNLYDKKRNKLIFCAGGNERTTFQVPVGVTAIASYAFSGCSYLEEVILPESVKTLESYAFAGCYALKRINAPGVQNYGKYFLDNCSDLEYFIFNEGLTVLRAETFDIAIKAIVLPKSLQVVEKDCIYWGGDFSGKFRTVYYAGTEQEWNVVEGKNELIAEYSTVYFYSEDEPEGEGNFWHYNSEGEVEIWE